MKHPPLRVVIDEAGFRRLVSGNPILAHSTAGLRVEIALSDIGWQRMVQAIIDAATEPHRPPDPPQAREFLPVRRRGP
jgi:hypothetical protein